METQLFHLSFMPVMTDPEWIALESIEDETEHFIFGDTMLVTLRERGLVEPQDGRWRVTQHGHQALHDRSVC